MAGIGFELKKLFVGHGIIKKVRAYAFTSIICSGTMMLAIALLLGIQAMTKAFGASVQQREILTCTLVYALFLSMVLTACFQTYLSRYVADQLYMNRPERVIPALIGVSLTLMIPGGIFYAWLLSTADEMTLVQKLLNWMLFMELIPTWLQMSYITAVKDYRAVLNVFAAGIVLALSLSFGLLWFGADPTTAPMLSLVIGYGVMLIGFMRVLLKYFPRGKGSAFHFIERFSQLFSLLGTGFLGMGGAFVHIFIMWFSPLGATVTGAFRQASMFDAAAFYAFLVTLPTNINFIVSVEVNFYSKYRHYFDAITNGAPIAQINLARDSMKNVLKQEISKLTQVQIFLMVIYLLAMRYLLPMIGFTTDMIAMFQIMCIGYSAYSIGNSLMLLQLYFNDKKGALFTAGVLFTVNLTVSLLTRNGPTYLFGLGIAAGGIATYLAALPRLLWYMHRINYHVYCSQPVYALTDRSDWARLAERLEARANHARRGNPGTPDEKEVRS